MFEAYVETAAKASMEEYKDKAEARMRPEVQATKEGTGEPTLPPPRIPEAQEPRILSAEYFEILHHKRLADKGVQFNTELTEYDYDDSTPGERTKWWNALGRSRPRRAPSHTKQCG